MFLFKIITKPIGCLFSFFATILVGLVLVYVAIVFGGSWLLPWAACRYIEARTSFEAEIGEVSVGLFPPSVKVENFSILNPPEYPEREFVWMEHVGLEIPLIPFENAALKLDELVIDIGTLSYVKTQDRETNFSRFTDEMNGSIVKTDEESSPATGVNESPPYFVERLSLQIGAVAYHDFSATPIDVQRVTVDYGRTFQEVDDFTAVGLLVARDLSDKGVDYFAKSAFASILEGLGLEGIKERAANMIDGIGEQLKGAGEGLKNLFESLND